jgi:hypothetical protein
MKTILFIIAMMFTTNSIAQEKKEYLLIDQNEIQVTIYNEGRITQQGTMKLYDGKWVNCGEWKQWGRDGKLLLQGKYFKGKKKFITAYDTGKTVTIVYNK